MKLDKFSEIFGIIMIVLVSGSIGYALKPTVNIDQKRLEDKYMAQQRACTQAVSIMHSFSKHQYYSKKTQKQIAIERMMSN